MILEAAILHALLAAPAIDLKCGGTMPFPGIQDRTPVIVIEGRVLVGDTETQAANVAAIQAEDIHHIEVTCWNPTTDEIPARDGVSVIVITTDRAVENARSDLWDLIAAVRDFEAAESRLPRTLEDLGASGGFIDGRFDLTVSDQGIELGTAGDRDYHCSVSGPIAPDAEMRCEPSVSLARVKLREAYDRATKTR